MANHKANQSDVQELDAHTTVRIPQWVHDRLRARAKAEYRTVSAEIRRLLIAHVESTDGDEEQKAA